MHRLNGQSVYQHEDQFPSDGVRTFQEPARPELWERLGQYDEFDFSALRPAGVIVQGDADYIPELDLDIVFPMPPKPDTRRSRRKGRIARREAA